VVRGVLAAPPVRSPSTLLVTDRGDATEVTWRIASISATVVYRHSRTRFKTIKWIASSIDRAASTFADTGSACDPKRNSVAFP
jgi:hypothetical protein